MRRARSGAIIGVLGSALALAVGLADCAEPTQIEIDIRTDGCQLVKNTGIAVASADSVETSPLTVFTPQREEGRGCEAQPKDRIGTLVVYPSGAKDAEVAVRIVTGVSRTAQECGQGPYAGCIVARRFVRFVPGQSQKVIVIMSLLCVGKDCGAGRECSAGQCVTVLPDGGVEDSGPAADSDLPDGQPPPPDGGDGGQVLEAGADACASCEGVGKTCTNGNTCSIDCSSANCLATTVCGPGLTCNVQCNAANKCDQLQCTAPGGTCNIACSADDSCKKIACNAAGCFVHCENGNNCRDQISLTGGDAGLTCSGNDACNNGGKAYCDAGKCTLACSSGGGNPNCPNPRECSPGVVCSGPWN